MADAIDFQPYLKSIIPDPTNQDGVDRYTPTQVELPLKVRAIVPENPGTPTAPRQLEQQKRERFEVLDGLRKAIRKHQQVLLIGKPGSGKSTALRRLLWEEAQQCLAIEEHTIPSTHPPTHSSTIPVLIELRDCRSGSVLEWLQKALRRMRLRQEAIEDLLFAGRLLLLFDGLNELPSTDAWVALDEFRRDKDFHTVPIIVTTRELGAGADLGIEKKLEMVPLTEPQMREFIQKRLPGQADNLLRQLKDRLRELAETPLLLQMLCDVVAESSDGQLPQNRGELFRQEFTQRYATFKPLRGRVSEDSRRFAPELLQHLAFVMTQGEPHTDPLKPTPSWLTIPKTQAEAILETYLTGRVAAPAQAAKEWLEDLLEFHLLQFASNPDEIEFHHQLFQEYYAAEALLRLLPNLTDTELKQKYLNYLKWTEAIALMLGLPDTTDKQAIQAVKLALNVDLVLGARLAGGAKLALQDRIVGLFIELTISECLKIRLAGLIGSDAAVRVIEKSLTGEIFEVREAAVEALRKVASQYAILTLIQTLKHTDRDTRCAAATKLREFDSELGVPDLLQTLLNKKEDSTVRVQVALILSKIKDASVTAALIQTFFDESEVISVRMNAAEALKNNIGSEAIHYLQQTLEDEDFSIIWVTVLALRDIGGDLVKLVLGEALLSKNPWTRMYAASALALNKDDDIVEWLIKAIQNEILAANDFSFQHEHIITNILPNLINALGCTGNKKSTPILFELSGWKDINVRASAIRALGKVGKESAIQYLVKILKEKDKSGDHLLFIRFSAAEALGETGDNAVLPILLEALEDESPFIRQGAVGGLEKLGVSEVTSVLAKVLKDENEAVRERAAVALDNMFGSTGIGRKYEANEAADALIQSLEDTSSTTRFHAAQALWRLGNKDTPTAPLIKSLEDDQEPRVRMSAARVLGMISTNDEAVKALTLALEDLDLGTRICAFEALGETAHPKLIQSLWDLGMESSESYSASAVAAIQARCEFYNYEIAQAVAAEESRVSGVGDGDTKDTAYTINAEVVQIIEKNLGDVIGQHPPRSE